LGVNSASFMISYHYSDFKISRTPVCSTNVCFGNVPLVWSSVLPLSVLHCMHTVLSEGLSILSQRTSYLHLAMKHFIQVHCGLN
jgi:hypothetical protein